MVTALAEPTTTSTSSKMEPNETEWEVLNPAASTLLPSASMALSGCPGAVGYYCAGMNKQANITVHGSSGPRTAENMMVWARSSSKAMPASMRRHRQEVDRCDFEATPRRAYFDGRASTSC